MSWFVVQNAVVLVGGSKKAKNQNELGGILKNLKIVAEAKGIKAQYYFSDNAPKSAIKLAKKRLGAENVFTFPEITLP